MNTEPTDARINRCCPLLDTAGCGDTEEHRHLVCLDSNCLISNDTVVSLCLGDFSRCIVNGGVE